MTKSLKTAAIIISLAVLAITIGSCSKKANDRYNRCPAFSKNTSAEKVMVSRNG
jgi:hypothetical protein